MTGFSAVDLIAAKRDGHQLAPEQITWLVDAYTAGAVPDEQMSAMAMAIFFQGLNPEELHAWTAAMLNSGVRLNFSDLGKPTVDKHSTGGVGDKITLPLTPLVASYGKAVPQLSGRGLGHTGGTLDKLEAIPGFRVDLSEAEIRAQLKSVGGVVCAPTGELAPADKKLYALRDVTATVESIPLIASSIMSKKIAEGTDRLVLDVKTGAGAFMKDQDSATELARTMVEIGTRFGVETTALITSMDTPLGMTVGNAVEIEETLEILAGGGPEDVRELTLALATEMLDGQDPTVHLDNGKAMDNFRAMVQAQGGDLENLPKPSHEYTVVAQESGVVQSMDALAVGKAAWYLGAGRQKLGDPVQATAGVRLHIKPGDKVKAGQKLFTCFTETPEAFDRALGLLENSISMGADVNTGQKLILDRISAENKS